MLVKNNYSRIFNSYAKYIFDYVRHYKIETLQISIFLVIYYILKDISLKIGDPEWAIHFQCRGPDNKSQV